ncbi:hypothetical protein CAPTEDRAFT_208072 [Capitella teleta]|uniref:Uncharacterized protein n=1 Tax=Capitella teleta TaxID=283909 RepID=R7UPN3_CAPTE|nr:hypothetical protein CAPTEDRAFT_208072 [Capitella teleta]|eukprot:ELU08484.1 hypothetical protein CAPTEDRAFT_208072 [Capitella teleta]
MYAVRLTPLIGMYLLFGHPEMIETNASCQCAGYEPLIVDVEDHQLSASSALDARFFAANVSKMTGIVTWGDQLKHYVKSFRIQHRSDGSDTWLNCTDTNGDTKRDNEHHSSSMAEDQRNPGFPDTGECHTDPGWYVTQEDFLKAFAHQQTSECSPQLARTYLRIQDAQWKHVVFSDEAHFEFALCPAGVQSDGGGSTIWAAFHNHAKSPIVFLESTLSQMTTPYATKMKYLDCEDVNRLPCSNCSPYINPFVPLWAKLSTQLINRKVQRTKVNELRQYLTEEWDAIPVKTVHSIIDGMPRRNPALTLYNIRGGQKQWVSTQFCKYYPHKIKSWSFFVEPKCGEMVLTFVGNENTIDPAFNELQGGITARYVRLLPISYKDGLGLRWELLACSNCVQPSVNHHTGSLSASYDGSNCIKIKDNNQIRMQWKGLVTNSNLTNLDISGKSLICSHYTTVVGIAVHSMHCYTIYCYTGYVLCKIKGVNGTCRAVCGLREEQVGQPFHLLLMVTGEGAELCDVTMDLQRLPTGRSGIDDWGVFMQEIAAK